MYAIPAPYTIFKDVISLLPGYTMSVSRNITKKHQYWDVPIGLWKENKKNLPRLKEELQIILNSAVSYAAVSDVPVGVFLSGGIDSSLLVAFLSRVSKSPIRSFTCWSSDGGVYDERLFAMEVAKKYNTIHTEYTVTEEEAFSDLVKMVYYLDQPDGGGLESFFITKKASGLKVCLAGAGGDELFAGYHEEIYLYNSAASVYQFTPYLLRKFFIRLLVRLFANKNDLISGADKLFSQKTLEDRRFFLYFPFLDEEKRSLFSPDWSLFRDLQTTEDFFNQFYNKVKEMHPIDRFMYVDLKTFTPSNILQNMDTMSMAHSLEVRSPLLDHRLIKLAAEIPPSLKRKRNIAKYILKEVAKSYLPKDVIYHKKTGFGLPRARYMRTRLRKYILEMLSEESVKKRGIFNPLIIKNILTDFYQRQKPYKLMKDNLRIWALLVLEIWFRLYIDRKIVVMPKLTLDDLI